MRNNTCIARHLALVALIAVVAGPARAVEFTLQAFGAGGTPIGTVSAAQLGCADGAITDVCQGQNITLGNLRIENLSISVDTDPIINGVVAVQNLAGTTQTFTMIFTLGVVPIVTPTLTGGSMAGGVTDNNGNGATLGNVVGTLYYTSLIDGAAWVPLGKGPVVAGPFDSADLTPEPAFGVPIPSLPGPAVAKSIGIRYDFTLTGLDSASFTGVFNVQPIPEPGTALLLGLGLAAMALAGRRR